MQWEKLGLIFEPQRNKWFSQFYGILPTPFLLNDSTIRVLFATSDSERNGRIFYTDVSAQNPAQVVTPMGDTPLLDLGEPGCFDDCGVIPSSVVNSDGQLRLYYYGFQRLSKISFLSFSGLAVFDEKKGLLSRIQKNPILERNDEELWIRSAPTILKTPEGYRMWYVSANRWEKMDDGIFADRLMPVYTVRQAFSNDGIHWEVLKQSAIEPQNRDEFGFGRPWVCYFDNNFHMWYSVRRRTVPYRIGYARSNDGIAWERKDDSVGIDISAVGWDSEMICYPAVIATNYGTYMFYNGNKNGEVGFGVARLLGEIK